MFNETLAILVATVLSGIMSGIYFTGDGSMQWGVLYGPGIFFGVATAGLFIWLRKTPFLKAALWAGASISSWFAAIQIYIRLPENNGGPIGLVVAGVCGAALLGSFYSMLVREISWQRFVVVVIAGGIMAAIMSTVLQQQDSASALRYIVSFVIWQVGVGLALAAELNSRK